MVAVVQRRSAAAAAHQADGAHHGLPTGNTCTHQPPRHQAPPRRRMAATAPPLALTLEGAALGAAGRDEIERDVWRPADVLVREAPALAFAAPTHPLAEEIGSSHQQDQQDDGKDGHDGVGAATAAAVGGRHRV